MKRSLKCAMRRWLMRLSLILLMAGILPAQAEDCPDWDAAVAYTAGQCATHAGTAYRAKWWNQGAAPDAADPWGAWEAANPPTPEPDACPAWSTSAIYTAGQCVTHAGRRYTARWWTQGETPVVSEWGAWAVQDTPVDPPPPVPTTPAGIYFIDADHLGTPRVISDEAGKIVWRWDFGEPFGDSQPDDDPDGDGVRFDFPLRFPGQYHDRETGLNYNYYRDYDPATGRYTTSDPIGLAGGINTYTYVGGGPVSYVDPTGEFAWIAPVVWYAGAAALGATAAWWGQNYNPAIPGKPADDPFGGGGALTPFSPSNGSQPASTPDDSDTDRQIWWPDKTPGKWVCKARADCNDNISGNCPQNPKHRFAFGGGSANSLGAARNIAKANTTANLQCQPKHVSCRCTGPKGEQYSGGC